MRPTAWLALALALLLAPARAAEFDYGPQPFGPHRTTERWGAYESPAADGKVRYFLVRPEGAGRYPGVYYVYGRPGLDHRLLPELRRLASYGFTVYVAHFQEALLIPILLPANDPPETLQVQIEGFEDFLKLEERAPGKVCVFSTVRGGNFSVILAARPEVGCYVGYHSALVLHGWPEQHQDVTVMPEVRKLRTPTLLMIGGADFETRQNQSKRVAQYLRAKGVPVELVVYPEAQRGFDFRVVNRTLADDLAKIDSMNRAIAFMSQHLDVGGAKLPTSRYAAAPLPAAVRNVQDPGAPPRAAPKGAGGGD
jgi:dienelactone hydrolase